MGETSGVDLRTASPAPVHEYTPSAYKEEDPVKKDIQETFVPEDEVEIIGEISDDKTAAEALKDYLKESSPVKFEDSTVKDDSPAKEDSPVKEESPIREDSLLKESSPSKETAVKEDSPVKETPVKEASPVIESVNGNSHLDENSNSAECTPEKTEKSDDEPEKVASIVKLQKLLEDGPVVVKDAVEDLVETIGSIGDDTDD